MPFDDSLNLGDSPGHECGSLDCDCGLLFVRGSQQGRLTEDFTAESEIEESSSGLTYENTEPDAPPDHEIKSLDWVTGFEDRLAACVFDNGLVG
jgi:hypothetical protein